MGKHTQAGPSASTIAEQLRMATKAKQRGGGLMLSLGTGDPWMLDDAKWFRKHPTRSFRIRAMLPGEYEHLIACRDDLRNEAKPTHMLVRQIEPGYRDRTPVSPDTADPAFDEMREDDELLGATWQDIYDRADGLSVAPWETKYAQAIRRRDCGITQGGSLQ